MAGYSATPLSKKLGIREGLTMHVHDAPEEYFDWLAPLPATLVIKEKLQGSFDFIHLFVHDRKQFEKLFVKSRDVLKKDGTLWISWPKQASKVTTDLDGNIIQEFGLREGLVDVKVCAVNEVWSGLKFMFRVKDR